MMESATKLMIKDSSKYLNEPMSAYLSLPDTDRERCECSAVAVVLSIHLHSEYPTSPPGYCCFGS
jgi:hypothetical protein